MKIFPYSERPLGDRQGWKRGEGDCVFVNERLGRVEHVSICDDNANPLWDQFLHFEPVGAVTVPVDTAGRFGIISVARPSIQLGKTYDFPPKDFSNLGRYSLEFPRGFPLKGESADFTAKREAEEELRTPILSVQKIGQISANTSFNPHQVPVFLVSVDAGKIGQSPLPQDFNEKILRVDWVDERVLTTAISIGKIYCAMTLASYALVKASWSF